MTAKSRRRGVLDLMTLWALAAALPSLAVLVPAPAAAQPAPRFAVDAAWPRPLGDGQILGQVAGIAVDGRDHIWIIHRPGSLSDDEKEATKTPPASRCCKPAKPVIELDQAGRVVRAWGGHGTGYDWPANEHGIHVDRDGNVWIAGNGKGDHQILKFTADGKFLLQIGKAGSTGGSNSRTQLGLPAHMQTDEAAGELYVADGYQNRRIVVFDMKTGEYKRHWGAYGEMPNDDKLAPYDPKAAPRRTFANPVHCIRIARDGLVYVCDRANDRIQVFTKGGTFVKEFRVSPETLANGSVWDLVLSRDPGERYLFVADGANAEILTLSRATGQVLGRFGEPGRMAGQFKWVHNLAIDKAGNLYTAEVGTGRRAQRFVRQR